jgi:hypothetical protein
LQTYLPSETPAPLVHYREEELNNLTSWLPNLPALDTPTNEEGNKVIDKTEYQHDIQHELTHETILKKLSLVDEEKQVTHEKLSEDIDNILTSEHNSFLKKGVQDVCIFFLKNLTTFQTRYDSYIISYIINVRLISHERIFVILQ